MAAPTKTAYQISLPSERELVMTRVFNAPRALVFRAHVDPTLIPHWWGPRGNTARVEKLEARPGGAWRFVVCRDDGSGEIAFFGEFREVVSPERFTWTFGFDGLVGQPGLETYVFEEHAGRTTLTATAHFDSAAERDALLASGMEGGANESAERLDELLARLQA